jgi:cytochrome c oxidase subunit 3
MGFFHQLTEKPWAPRQGNVVELHDGIAFSVPTATLGVRVFLAVVTVLFLLLIMAYGSRMEFEDWRPAPQVGLLWLNTGMLVLSSIAMQWAKIASRRDDGDGVRTGLIAGGAFAVAFLAGQVWAWRQLNMVPVFDITNPAIGFFYLITALHGLHLLGGLVAWGMTTAKLWRGSDVARVRLSVGLCAVYWHFLLVVWLVLFGLLFSGNDNLGLLLAICGIR